MYITHIHASVRVPDVIPSMLFRYCLCKSQWSNVLARSVNFWTANLTKPCARKKLTAGVFGTAEGGPSCLLRTRAVWLLLPAMPGFGTRPVGVGRSFVLGGSG